MALLMRPAARVKKAESAGSQEVLDRLQAFLESGAVTGEPVEILCGFWEEQQNAVSYQEIRQAVLDGTVSREMLQAWAQDYARLAAGPLGRLWTAGIDAGAHSRPLPDGTGFRFQLQSPGIMNWLGAHGAELVTSCTEEQRKAIAALVTKKMRDSHTVDELARMIRPCIGLTKGQAEANARYHDSIVLSLRKEHPRMKAESIEKKALEASMKYAERQHRYRAMMTARTESAYAYNFGADEGIRQARAQGLLGRVKKRWSTSGDERVCNMCASLEGMEIEMDAEFRIRKHPSGQCLLPPAHPSCGCAVEYIEE